MLPISQRLREAAAPTWWSCVAKTIEITLSSSKSSARSKLASLSGFNGAMCCNVLLLNGSLACFQCIHSNLAMTMIDWCECKTLFVFSTKNVGKVSITVDKANVQHTNFMHFIWNHHWWTKVLCGVVVVNIALQRPPNTSRDKYRHDVHESWIFCSSATSWEIGTHPWTQAQAIQPICSPLKRDKRKAAPGLRKYFSSWTLLPILWLADSWLFQYPIPSPQQQLASALEGEIVPLISIVICNQ